MSIVMYDSIRVDQIPADAQAAAGYVDGHFANVAELRDRFPHAQILTIAVFARDDAEALDIETGDATPDQVPAWYARQKARGVARPCLYSNVFTMDTEVLPALRRAGIDRAAVRLWSAHYTDSPHICGPSTCRELAVDADGCQWTSSALGRDLDESLLAADFFGATPSPVPAWQETMMNALPTLTAGAADKPGEVYFVHRMQALIQLIGEIKDIASAACQETTGVFDTATVTALKAVQASFGLTADAVCGPRTWAALVTGSH